VDGLLPYQSTHQANTSYIEDPVQWVSDAFATDQAKSDLDNDAEQTTDEDYKLNCLVNHCDYAFVTSYENAPTLKAQLNPMVEVGDFHYRAFMLGGLGELMENEFDREYVYEGEELDELHRHNKEELLKGHKDTKVMFCCSFEDNILDLQAQMDGLHC